MDKNKKESKPLSTYQKFDNWLWHGEHSVFRNQARMQASIFHGDDDRLSSLPKYVRLVCLILLIC